MTYPQFRCTECSLMRCVTPNVACDECLENIGIIRERFGSIVSDIINISLMTPPPSTSFVNVPKGYNLAGFLTACVAEGPGMLHCVASNLAGGTIRIFDGNTHSSSSPQLYSQMVNFGMVYEWINAPASGKQNLQIPFKSGMTVSVYNGDFALRFSDVLGNMYLIPY